ncbi:O-antigen ligase family protein [Hydrocarboniphaga daqingensis]|uniref:O-antigen ligase family protein n=1 Tax=Hydrocarboniphaga daqingensis TaxID=490188 RepID=UPI000A05B5CC|nr:O-antigen ligase family protein [Hydrocarboniphaga daqingensis]
MSRIAPAFARAASRRVAAVATPVPALPQPMSRDRYAPVTASMLAVLVLLMIVPEGFDYRALADGDAPSVGTTGSRLLWLTLLGAGSLAMLLRLTPLRRMASHLNLALPLFVLLVATSITWSDDPPVTARRLIRLVTILVCTSAVVLVGWHPRRFQALLRPLLTGVLIASLIFGLAWPSLAIHPDTDGVLMNAWHGLANHKNGLGDIASIALILWMHALLSGERRWSHFAVGSGIALACLLLSRSSTSMVATAFTLLMMTLLLRTPPSLRIYLPYLVAAFVAALLTYSLAVLDLVPGLGLLLKPLTMITGKDLSFTGRTEIWEIVTEHIARSPWHGSGYGAYWTGVHEGTPSYELVTRLGFYPASAHNGYLEVLNDLGIAGLLILAAYLLTFVRQALRLLAYDRTQACLYLALFLQQAIVNLSESRWFSSLTVDFVIMTLATVSIARALLDQRWQRRRRSAMTGNSAAGSRSMPAEAVHAPH